MAIVIPIKDNPNHTLLISLENVLYTLAFKYNSIGEFWTMDVIAADDVLILAGIKIIPNYPMLSSHRSALLPTGDFLCETADKSARIVRDSFSSGKSNLLYLTRKEVEAL